MVTVSDLQYGPLATLLVILFFLTALWRFPAANVFLGYTVLGLGGIPVVRNLTYAQTVVVLQVLASLVLLFQVSRTPFHNTLRSVITAPAMALPVLFALIWAKIAIDCGLNGVDHFRLLAAKTAAFSLLLPVSILFLSLLRSSIETVARDLLVGLTVLPLIYILPAMKPMLSDGRLVECFFGADRLTIYGQDTINAGRMFFLGALGFIFAAVRPGTSTTVRMVFTASSFAFLALLILNGTRQFFIAIFVAYAVALVAMQRQSALKRIVIVGSVGALLAIIALQFRQTQTSYRVQGEAIRQDGRLSIWMEKFQLLQESPFLGIGFRNGGNVYAVYTAQNDLILEKDTVHGFLQEVFVEHGIILGFAVLLAVGNFVHRVFSPRLMRLRDARFVLGALACSLMVAELFSSAVFNALGFHTAAVISLFMFRTTPNLPPHNPGRAGHRPGPAFRHRLQNAGTPGRAP